MAAVEDGDVIQISVRSLCFGQQIILTRNFVVAEPSNEGLTYVETMNALLNKFFITAGGSWFAAYLPCVAEESTVEEVRAQRIFPTRDVFVSQFPAGTGGGAAPANTANIQGAITFRTELAGRKEVSTIKVGPIANADSADGLLAADLLTRMRALRTFLATPHLDSVSGVGIQPCIFHPETVPPTPRVSVIRAGIVQPQTRVMVRRTVGRGK